MDFNLGNNGSFSLVNDANAKLAVNDYLNQISVQPGPH